MEQDIIFEEIESLLCLLFIYCSYLDNNFSSEEQTYISTKFNSQIYTAMYALYQEKMDTEILQIILHNLRLFYPDRMSLDTINEQLEGIFIADGHIHKFESAFQEFMNRYVNLL